MSVAFISRVCFQDFHSDEELFTTAIDADSKFDHGYVEAEAVGGMKFDPVSIDGTKIKSLYQEKCTKHTKAQKLYEKRVNEALGDDESTTTSAPILKVLSKPSSLAQRLDEDKTTEHRYRTSVQELNEMI